MQPQGDAAPLLDSERAAALGRTYDLATVARVLADAAMTGRHRAGGRGGAAEFYDFRPYTPGDAPRLIDWRLAGRTDRLYLRRFRQEGRLSLVCIVDASASMDFGGIDRPRAVTKFRRAKEIAAALAYVAVKRGDAAGVVVARGGEPQTATSGVRAGWPGLHECIAALEGARCDAPADAPVRTQSAAVTGGVARAMDVAGAMLPRGGVVVVISDGLDEPALVHDSGGRLRFARGAGAMGGNAAGCRDVVFVQILTREERELPTKLAARLIDPETGMATEVDAAEAGVGYARTLDRHIESLRAGLLRIGASHHLCSTEHDPVDVVRMIIGK
jgi:uncharacterized protein (DUF58 family)